MNSVSSFPYCLAGTKTSDELESGIVIFHEKTLVLGTQTELKRIFNSHRYQVKKYVYIDRFIYLHCLKCVLVNATCEREIFKLF